MILKPSKNWGPYFLRSLVCYGHRLSKILWQIWTQQDHWTLQYIKYYGSFGKYIAWHEIIAFPWSLITKVRRNLSLHFRKIYDHLWKTRDTAKTETIFESETFCVCHALLGQLVSVALTRVAEIKSHWHGAQPVAALATQRFPEQAIWDLGGHTRRLAARSKTQTRRNHDRTPGILANHYQTCVLPFIIWPCTQSLQSLVN